MTFGIGFVHPLYAGVVTDRRISGDGWPPSDQYDKAGLVEFSNARFAYTMSGLAKWHDFDAATWTATALAEAGFGGVEFHVAFARFTAMCTHKISSLGLADPQDRKFTVLFAGYERADDASITRFVMVSNFRKLSEFSGSDYWPEPFDSFDLSFQQTTPVRCLALSIGGGRFAEENHLVQKLVQRFQNPRTTSADAVKVLVDLIRENANAQIGEDCTSVVIPSDFGEDPAASYHPNYASSEFRFPVFVQASHGAKGAGFAINGVTRHEGEPGSPPVVTAPAPVSKRQKCYCGNGLEYRECHGKRSLPKNSMPAGTTDVHYDLDTRQLAAAAGGAHFVLPSYLFLPGTRLDDYKITNMRTGVVVQDRTSNPGG